MWALFLAPAAAAQGQDDGVVAGVSAGYFFRSQQDDRAHGAAGDLVVDTPSLGPLSLRVEGLGVGLGPSAVAPQPLAFWGGAVQAVYRFDETQVRALAGVGPLVGATVEGQEVHVTTGVLASLTLRFPLAPATFLEARLFSPIVLLEDATPVAPLTPDTRWPLQAGATIGLAVAVDALLRGAETKNPSRTRH